MSNLSRRFIVTSAAALPALAVPAVAATSSVGDDTLERIAEHRRLTAMIDRIIKREPELEKEIPADRRKAGHITDRGTDIGKDDDPRWAAYQADYWAASDAHHKVKWSFVDRPPTSIAAAAALMAYVVEYDRAGYQWSGGQHFISESGSYNGYYSEDWRTSLTNEVVPLLFAKLAA